MCERKDKNYIDQIDFRFTVRNVRKLTTTTSSQVYVNGLPWQVKLQRKGDDIFIQLCCNNPNNSPNWSCASRAIFKLLSFSKSEILEKRQDIVAVFSAKLSYVIRNVEFVKWQDLFDPKKQYVFNNTMMVDVTIQAEQQRDATQSRLINVEAIRGQATFGFKLFNFSEIIAMNSPEFTYRGMKCKLTISKRYPVTREEIVKNKNGYLGIWLRSGECIESSFGVRVIFRLLSHKIGGENFEKSADIVTSNRFNYSSRLIPLRELYENQNEYVYKDSIQLEVDISIENKNASSIHQRVKSAPSVTMDCILCFDNMINRPIQSTPCGHLFCRTCIEKSLIQRAACPICNKIVVREQLHDIFLPAINRIE